MTVTGRRKMPFSASEETDTFGTPNSSRTDIHKMEELKNETECSSKCRSKGDAASLIAAITRGTDQQSLAYLSTSGICGNPGKVVDHYGRTLLHVAASLGKKSVVEWLIRYKGANLNTKDLESGYTALHRSLYYGHIGVAKLLIEKGSNITLLDHEGLTPIDHVTKDRAHLLGIDVSSDSKMLAGCLGEVYVWGANDYFNLGLEHQQQKSQPTLLEQLSRSSVYISKVALQKFHSAILTTEGNVLTFGHGQGGKLGHGNEDSQLKPRQLNILKENGNFIDIALGLNHSMFLASNGTVWVCGSNESYQLGIAGSSQSTQILSPQPIGGSKIASANSKMSADKQAISSVLGIAASRYHSAFWTKDSVYTWGLNAGQLGHIKGENSTYITSPRLVSSLNSKDIEISCVTSSEGALVVQTSNGELFALFEYQTKRRITNKRIPDISKVSVTGGHLDSTRVRNEAIGSTKLVEKGGTELKIFVLTKSGKVYIWEGNSITGKNSSNGTGLIPCTFNLNRQLLVKDIAVNKSNVLLISSDGNGYEAVHVSKYKNSPCKTEKHSAEMMAKSPPKNTNYNCSNFTDNKKSASGLIRIKQRINGIHRGVNIGCDPKGKNFCAIQIAPNATMFDIPDIG